MKFDRRLVVGMVLALALAVVFGGVLIINAFGGRELCGPGVRAQPGVEVKGFDIKPGTSVTAAVSLVPLGDTPVPVRVGQVVVGDGWEVVEDSEDSRGLDRTFLGYLRSASGDCRLWVHRLTGDAMPAGSPDAWMVTVMEVQSHD
jgi:hypothetical protein